MYKSIVYSIILLLFTSLAGRLSACSCGPIVLSESTFILYDIVIDGTIVGIEEDVILRNSHSTITPGFDSYQTKYTVQINELIKGSDNNKTIDIYSSKYGSACGVFYDIGDQLVLFSFSRQGCYFTGSCAPNVAVGDLSSTFATARQEYKDLQGDLRYWYKPNGNIPIALGKIEVNSPVGYWEHYDYRGRLRQDGHYVDGLKDGTWIRYRYDSRDDECPIESIVTVYKRGVELRNSVD